MDWKQRASDLLADAKRYGKNALIGWGDSIREEFVYHAFTAAVFLVLGIGIAASL